MTFLSSLSLIYLIYSLFTQILLLNFFSPILTAYEFESRYGEDAQGLGPGTIQVTNRPPSRDDIRPRRDEPFHVST